MAPLLVAKYGQLRHGHSDWWAARAIIGQAGSLPPRKLAASHAAEIDHNICNSGYAHATRKSRAASTRKILIWLWQEHGAKKLDHEIRKHPGLRPRSVTVKEAEIDAILVAAPSHLRLWILLCADLGIRSGTASAIGPKEYNPQRKELRFTTKYGAKLTMPVTETIAEILATCEQHGTVSFVRQLMLRNWSGKGRSPEPDIKGGNYLGKLFTQLRRNLGITRRIIPHDLRRTVAVGMLEHTGDIRDVQALLGHRQLSSTLWYLDHDIRPISRNTLELIKGNRSNPGTKGPKIA